MKLKVINSEYLKCVTDAINYYEGSYKEAVITSIFKTDHISKEMEFDLVDAFSIPGKALEYVVIQNIFGTFIAREDNVIEIEELEDIFDDYGIKRILRSGNKTILITNSNEKFITTRDKDDKDDIEKALAFVLLKAYGMSIQDFYKLVNSIK